MRDEYTVGIKSPPLKIDTIVVPSLPGMIGISACPGMNEFSTLDLYDDRIENDLQCIINWGGTVIVTVLPVHEIAALGVTALPAKIVAKKIIWVHLPMSNNQLPEDGFEEKWQSVRTKLVQLLQQGERILIHCKEGVGRSALVAVRLLIESGIEADMAIGVVRNARPGSLMFNSQRRYCQSFSTSAPVYSRV